MINPSPASYGDIVAAMRLGRSAGADVLAVKRLIASQSAGPQRDHYKQLAESLARHA